MKKESTTDLTMDQMVVCRLKKKLAPMVAKLLKLTHFNSTEIESLLLIYHKVTQDGPLDRKRYQELVHGGLDMTSDVLTDRIFHVLDKTRKLILTPESWVMAMSLFLRGSWQERIDYCFAVYNLQSDDILTKDIMFYLLKKCIVGDAQDDEAEEGVRDLVDVVLKRADVDRDGKVSYKDFNTVCQIWPLFMECLGDCLPSKRSVRTFLSTFTPRTGELLTCVGKE